MRSEILYLRGHIEHHSGSGSTAVRLLLDAIDIAEAHDSTRAVQMLAEAFETSLHLGNIELCVEIAARVDRLASRNGSDAFYAALIPGVAAVIAGDQERGEWLLRNALDLVDSGSGPEADQHLHWGSLAAHWLNRAERAQALTERAIR